MSLIIGVGHGMYTDPFTCSTSSEDSDDVSKVEDCLLRLQANQFPNTKLDVLKTWIDEILVVEDNDVVHHFSWEDGLGEDLPEVDEEVIDEDALATPSDFIDFSEEDDDSDSEDA